MLLITQCTQNADDFYQELSSYSFPLNNTNT